MKRKLLFSFIVACILLIPSVLASAASTEYDQFTIDIVDDHVVIKKYNGYGGNINLEEVEQGVQQQYGKSKKITGIGNGAFQGKTTVTRVTLSKNVKSIGNNAFSGCDHLTRINLEDTELESIGNSAFSNCIRLTQVQLPDSLQAIGSGAFQGCVSEEKISIPESVKTIPANLFNGCTALLEVKILAKDCTSIGSSAFAGCTNLEHLIIPDSVSELGTGVFKKSALTGLHLPNNITIVPADTFNGCTNLTWVEIPLHVVSIERTAFAGCTSIEHIVLPDNLVYLGESVFSGCNSLTEMYIPGPEEPEKPGIVSVSNSLFDGCSALKSVRIPASCTSIGHNAFRGCTVLDEIVFSDKDAILSIGNYSFQNSGITEMYLPKLLKTIGDYTFSGCGSLETVVIDNAVTSIGTSAFANCAVLNRITVPDSVTNIEANAFSGCTQLSTVQLPTNNRYTEMKNGIFNGCANLTAVNIPDPVVTIGNNVFKGCKKLETVTLPDTVNGIGSSAFGNCEAMIRLDLPDSITTIADNAFTGCKALVLHANCSSYAQTWIRAHNVQSVIENHGALTPVEAVAPTCTTAGNTAGGKCTVCEDLVGVEQIPALGHDWTEITYTWADANSTCTAARECRRDASHNESETVIATRTKFNAPTETKSGSATYVSAKYKNTAFVFQTKKITIPAIKDMFCLNLPNQLDSIGKSAFENGAFQCVIVPDGCKSIGERAFADCDELLYVRIPSSTVSIAEDAFKGSKNVVIDKAE